MATITRVQLRNAVMHDLGILDPNESLRAEDATLVDARVQSTLERLYADGLIPFNLDGDAIPASYQNPLSWCIGPSVAPSFGMRDQLPALLAMEKEGLRMLRRLKARPYFGTVATANYF